MNQEDLGTAKVGLLRSLDKANKIGHWLAGVWIFPSQNQSQVGVAAIWDNLPILAVTRGLPIEGLPKMNQALIEFMNQTGTKIVNVSNQNGVLVAGNKPDEKGKIVLPGG